MIEATYGIRIYVKCELRLIGPDWYLKSTGNDRYVLSCIKLDGLKSANSHGLSVVKMSSLKVSTHAPSYEFRIIPLLSGQVNLAKIVVHTLCLLI